MDGPFCAIIISLRSEIENALWIFNWFNASMLQCFIFKSSRILIIHFKHSQFMWETDGLKECARLIFLFPTPPGPHSFFSPHPIFMCIQMRDTASSRVVHLKNTHTSIETDMTWKYSSQVNMRTWQVSSVDTDLFDNRFCLFVYSNAFLLKLKR